MSSQPPVVPAPNVENTAPNAGAGQQPVAAPNAGRRKMVKPKMDFAKALSIMGFSTSRTLDPSGGHDARVELNAALSRKMADIEKRKRAANKKDQTKVEDKLRDEIRTLHEAYQFLSRKYIKLAEIRKDMENEEEEDQETKNKQRRKMKKLSDKKQDMDIDRLLQENEDMFLDDDEFEEDYYDDEVDGERKNSQGDREPKTPSRKKSSKRKKTVSEPLENINEDLPLIMNTKSSNDEENEEEGQDQISDLVSELESEILSDDEVFGEHNAEVSLCQLINETFKFSEDDDYFDFD